MQHMDRSELPEATEAEPGPSYAELASRLLVEHAELFRISRPRWDEADRWAPMVASRRRPPARRSAQLSLQLRPRVIDGGRKERR